MSSVDAAPVADGAEAPPPEPTTTRVESGDLAAIASIVALVVTILVVGHGLWFFSDDWNILADYHAGNLLQPFNNHLSLVPAGIYAALFHTVGLGSYVPYQLVGIAGMAALGIATWRYSRSRVGAWGGALATTALIWGSGGATNLMFPFLVNFSLPIALLVVVWYCIDRGTPRSHLVGAVTLAVALATSGLGVLVAAAVLVELALRRILWRRGAVHLLPIAVWALWYLGHRVSAPGDHGVRPLVSYSARMLWGGATALAGGWKPGGIALGVALVGYFGVAALQWRSLDARVIGALSAPLLFAGLTAYTRLGVVPAIPPDEFRYRWTIAAFVVLAVVSAWRRPHPPILPATLRTVVALGAVALVALGAVLVVRDSRRWADMVRAAAPGLRAELFAAEAVGARVGPGTVLPLSYVPVTLGGYLDAVADVGSPLDGHPAARFGGSTGHRRSADRLLARLPARPGTAVPTGCPRLERRNLRLAPGSTVLVAPATPERRDAPAVTMSRFGDVAVPVRWTTPVGDIWQVRVPTDAAHREGAPLYRIRLQGTDGAEIRVCPP